MEDPNVNFARHFLEVSIKDFQGLKKLADRAVEQLRPEDFHRQPDPESNSVAIIIKHMAGNMLSRWTDFLITDGEKMTRNRDGEFIDDFGSAEEIIGYWEKGWARLFETLTSLTDEDLRKTVYIRNEPHTVVQAICRQIAHYGNHVG